IHYEAAEAVQRASRLRDLGFDAHPYTSLGAKGFRGIREDPPDAILIDLNRLPSYGRVMGALIRESKSLRSIPLVFITGDPAKTRVVRETLPDAVYTPWSNIASAVEGAIARPLKSPLPPKAPVRALPAKLGIGRDSVVALVNAPRGFALQLPPGARTQTATAGATTVLAFFRSRAAFGRELPAIVRGIRKDCRYWIVWPKKSSGEKSDLSMVSICGMAAAYGLAVR